MSRPSCLLLCILVTLLAPPRVASAAWPSDPAVNLPLCAAPGDQYYQVAASDGAGGAVVAWVDHRSGGYTHIYAQRVDASGTPLWAEDGVAVCTAAGDQQYPVIAPDGAGGAIVAWFDYRGGWGDVYAQRIAAAGTPQWAENGVALCSSVGTPSPENFIHMIPDGTGGALVTWPMRTMGAPQQQVFIQSVDASGTARWTANGVAVASTEHDQHEPQVVRDGTGGAIVAWQDYRADDYWGDVYAQRVDATGTPQWTAGGVPLCTATGDQTNLMAKPDGAGGVVVVWEDERASEADIYAQRVSASGSPQWTTDGAPVCVAAGGQFDPMLVPDGSGGGVIAWPDMRDGAIGLYAQRIDGSGATLWPGAGVVVCSTVGEIPVETITPLQMASGDGAGGVIVAWWDKRNGTDCDIYAQRVDASGVVQWPVGGTPVSTAAGDQLYPSVVSDGSGGIVAAWRDSRDGSWDIYAQRLYASGSVDVAPGATTSALRLDSPVPNPSRSGMRIAYALPQASRASLAIYDLHGRRVRGLLAGHLPAGEGSAHWDGLDESGRPVASGLYFARLDTGGSVLTARFTTVR